jgi:hypothetical protein
MFHISLSPCAAKSANSFGIPYSTASVARRWNEGGKVRPRAFAVLRLIANYRPLKGRHITFAEFAARPRL